MAIDSSSIEIHNVRDFPFTSFCGGWVLITGSFSYLFPKLKSKLKGHHFGTMENIQIIVTDELNTLTENDFQYCYDQWKKRWNHCVTSQGSYFEGDNL